MRLTWRVVGFGVVCLGVFVGAYIILSSTPAISTRLRTDINVPVFEITNRTSNWFEVNNLSVEAYHNKTGWWPVRWPYHFANEDGRIGHVRFPIGPYSRARCEISLPGSDREGSAHRVNFSVTKIESQRVKKIRSTIASLLNLSDFRFFAPKPRNVQLAFPTLPPCPTTTLPYLPIEPTTFVSSNASTSRIDKTSPEPPCVFQIKILQTELREVLDLYAELANTNLEIAPRIRSMEKRLTIQSSRPLSRFEALSLIEQELQHQAGITVQHLGKQRVKLNYPSGN